MTKDEAIDLIRNKRVGEWNIYRMSNPNWKPNLRDFEFPPNTLATLDKDLNLTKCDLRGAKFSRFYLHVVKLEGSDLRNADLSEVSSLTISEKPLQGALYNIRTKWPRDFAPEGLGAILVSEGPALTTDVPKVFLSYAWADKKLILAIDQWLRNKGLETRIDERDFFAGSRIRDSILEVMKTCDAVVIFYSDSSKNKPWPEFERELAADLEMEAKKGGKTPPRIIYVVLGDNDLPNVTERNRIAVMTKGKKFSVVCEEVYRGILGLSRDPQDIDLADWENYLFRV